MEIIKNILKENIYTDIQSIVSNTDFSYFKNKTVMVTGASKLLGYYLTCAMLVSNDENQTNTKVIAVDTNDSLFKKYGKVTHRTDLDFMVSDDFSNLQTDKVDVIIHCDTNHKVNTINAITNILDFAKNNTVRSILLAADMDIYGTVFNGSNTLNESDQGYINLQSDAGCHAQAQRMAENITKKFSQDYNVDVKLVRLCNVLGGIKMNENDTYSPILSSVAKKHNITITKDDCKVESCCYVTDCVTAVLTVLAKGKSQETYNISADLIASPRKVSELCTTMYPDYKIKVILKKDVGASNYPSPMNPTMRVLDNKELLALGFTPQVKLEESIIRSIKIINENQ